MLKIIIKKFIEENRSVYTISLTLFHHINQLYLQQIHHQFNQIANTIKSKFLVVSAHYVILAIPQPR
jgi:hypothetical protein